MELLTDCSKIYSYSSLPSSTTKNLITPNSQTFCSLKSLNENSAFEGRVERAARVRRMKEIFLFPFLHEEMKLVAMVEAGRMSPANQLLALPFLALSLYFSLMAI